MSKERKLRLLQVAKEFKVGIATITDFLEKKGIEIESSPNTPVDGNVYAVLEKEFGANRSSGEKTNIRDRINLKAESVSLHDKKDSEQRSEDDFKEEVIIKSGVISVQDEIRQNQPKIIGKIDLDARKGAKTASTQPEAAIEDKTPAAETTETPKQAPVTVKVDSSHKAEAPKKEEAPAQSESVKAPEAPLAAAEKEYSVQAKAEQKVEPVKTTDRAEKVAAEVKQPAAPVSPEASNSQPAVQKEVVIQEKTYDDRMAASTDNIFRPDTGNNKLEGPKVLGKIDVKELQKSNGDGRKREKRKRIGKDKVDVSKQPAPNNQGKRGDRHSGGPAAQGGGGRNQQPVSKKDKKKRANVKPIVRPEVSEEEVQKQIKDTLARLTQKGGKSKGAVHRKEKRMEARARMDEVMEQTQQEELTLRVTEFVTVSELASMMNVSVTDVITVCMNLGLMVSINQRLDAEALVIVADEFGYKVDFVSVDIQEAISEEVDREEDLMPRPPIVAVMGHVDHGKTSLLDHIRETNVIGGEAGGITQHIGAYSVEMNGRKITFLDTPGHEAFTAMRARGAKVTDVAIIIVAADDSVMPQTIEAINHAAAAGVPMVFAINKIDKPNANPERIREQLAGMNYLVDDWGGKYLSQEVSAKKGLNLDHLLEKVLLEAEMLDLKANPNRKAAGTVIESTLDKGRGYVSTILVETGTLRIGDVLLAGIYSGRVKAMFNERGQRVTEALPSMPVLVLGLNGAPQAGDTFNVMEDDRSAREIANKREQLQRIQDIKTQKHITLDEIGRRIAIGNFKELNIIVKGDVDGSIEAMTDSLLKLSKEEVQVNVIHKAVGQISESDVLLAVASNAVIVGFQVRPSSSARKTADKEGIEIRLYSIIYDAINDIKDAIEGMLEPEKKEEIVCSVEVLETFKISKIGVVAGCIVREGKIHRNTSIRVIRDGIVIHTGRLGSLKRFKDDVKEVSTGMECGLNIDNFNDIKTGDIVEGYEIVEIKRKS